MQASETAAVSMGRPERPVLTDIAPLESIMQFKYRPASYGNSYHLMTEQELREGIHELQYLADAASQKVSRRAEGMQRELRRRRRDTVAEKTWRLRARLAWEFWLDRKALPTRSWPEKLPREVRPYG